MGRQFVLLAVAFQFLTRLPVPRLRGFDPAWVSRSARYYPVVGATVGAICGAVFLAASNLWPPMVAALLAVAAGVLITGGFHEDGLADTADGLGGGQDVAQRLEIMKDSRVGTYGVLALILTLGLKVATLADFASLQGALVLLAAHGLARGGSVLAMRFLPYVGEAQGGKWTPSPLHPGEVATALVLAAWPLALLPPAMGALGLAVGAGLALAMALIARRLIGGQTGDVLGAIEQMFELGFLLGAVVLA